MDINDAKVAIKEVAIKRMDFAEYWLNLAKTLLDNNTSVRNVLGRAYYGMYHAARAAVYIQMRLDVTEHRALVKQFK
ncbi:MAG: hypothetical protein ACE5KT_07205 [Methanosarcinales archaeon]